MNTGKVWGLVFGISFENFDGWFSEKDFNEEKISRFEFLNRASQSKVVQPKSVSRREANKYKQNLIHGNFSKT